MTVEEAINEMKSLLISADDDFFRKSEAIEIAIDALEKQIPKKPIKLTDWGNNRCPCCGTLYGENGVMENYDYCTDCGQKIDWSDEK